MDSSGVVYIADTGNHAIRAVAPTGIIRTIAGGKGAGLGGEGVLLCCVRHPPHYRTAHSRGWLGSSTGGPALSAQLTSPVFVALDTVDNLYVVESGVSLVRMISHVNQSIAVLVGLGYGTAANVTSSNGDGGCLCLLSKDMNECVEALCIFYSRVPC